MSDYGDGGGDGTHVFARGIPSVLTRPPEAGENAKLAQASALIFAASVIIMFFTYWETNIAGYRIPWLWPALVRAAMVAPAIFIGIKICKFFSPHLSKQFNELTTGDLDWWLTLGGPTIIGFLVWWFLAGDSIFLGMTAPFGDIARFFIWSFDYPEGAPVGEVLNHFAAALGSGMLTAFCLALVPLIKRMTKELTHPLLASIELATREMDFEHEKQRAAMLRDLGLLPSATGGGDGDVAVRPVKRNRWSNGKDYVPEVFSGRTLPELIASAPHYEPQPETQHVFIEKQKMVGVTGRSERAKGDIVVPADKARAFIVGLANGRPLRRTEWVGDGPDKILTRNEWEAMCDVLRQASAWDSVSGKLTKPAEVLLAELNLLPVPNGEATEENGQDRS